MGDINFILIEGEPKQTEMNERKQAEHMKQKVENLKKKQEKTGRINILQLETYIIVKNCAKNVTQKLGMKK